MIQESLETITISAKLRAGVLALGYFGVSYYFGEESVQIFNEMRNSQPENLALSIGMYGTGVCLGLMSIGTGYLAYNNAKLALGNPSVKEYQKNFPTPLD